MNDRVFRTILKRYEAEIKDALYKVNIVRLKIKDYAD